MIEEVPTEGTIPPQPSGSSGNGGGEAGVYPVANGVSGASDEPPAQRIIHDVPPVWDGKDPDNQAEPYLKLLAGWLATTRTMRTQRGMTILHYASGDLKLIINELDVEALTADDGGQKVLDHVKEAFVEYMEKKLPKAMERALYAPDCRRQKGETMIQYV